MPAPQCNCLEGFLAQGEGEIGAPPPERLRTFSPQSRLVQQTLLHADRDEYGGRTARHFSLDPRGCGGVLEHADAELIGVERVAAAVLWRGGDNLGQNPHPGAKHLAYWWVFLLLPRFLAGTMPAIPRASRGGCPQPGYWVGP